MSEPKKYRPQAPSEAERRWTEFHQAIRLPSTLRAIYSIVREDFCTAALDEYLWAFWGFHQESWDPHYRMRPWQKVQLRSIEPSDVVALPPWEIALMFNIAMEDEEPILEYTHQSGEGFRYLLPTLGRFMGANKEQARYATEHGLPWCEGPWCAEERRHSNTLARMIARVMKMAPARDNPNQPMVVTADEEAALQHLLSRQTTEWNASSSYVVMGAHAIGHLHGLIRNLARDEIKHFAIMSAASAYLFGFRPWKRFLEVVKKGLDNYGNQRRKRSGGRILGTNPVTAIEGIVAHLLTMYYINKWLKTVPLRTLTAVFETPSKLPELAAFAPPPERQAEMDEALRLGQERRLNLERWQPDQRRRALEQRRVDEQNGGSVRLLRACLRDRIRDAEIRNNWHVAARGDGVPSVRPTVEAHCEI